jgi:hypothetical protein
LGVQLGPYVGRGYDCISSIQFDKLPRYHVPIEIKRYSSGYTYQMSKYGKDELTRAVILCAVHNLENTPRNVDVLELSAMCHYVEML